MIRDLTVMGVLLWNTPQEDIEISVAAIGAGLAKHSGKSFLLRRLDAECIRR